MRLTAKSMRRRIPPPQIGLDHPVGRLGQGEAGEEFVAAAAHGRPIQTVELADHPEVFAPGQELVDRGGLGGQAHGAA